MLIVRDGAHSRPYLELKNQLDELIQKNGGETVWLPCKINKCLIYAIFTKKYLLLGHTTYCVVAEFACTFVRSFCLGSQFNNVAVLPSWVHRCVSQNKFLPFGPNDILHCEPFKPCSRPFAPVRLKYIDSDDE